MNEAERAKRLVGAVNRVEIQAGLATELAKEYSLLSQAELFLSAHLILAHSYQSRYVCTMSTVNRLRLHKNIDHDPLQHSH